MELVKFPSRGGLSVRSIITFGLTVMLAALFWALFASTPTHAATTATWSGDSTILFDGHGYTHDPSFKDSTGTIPAGATVYKAPLQPADSSGTQKMMVLYFAPGVDPPTATSVSYVEFDYKNGNISNPHNQQTPQLAKQGTSDGTGSSCSVGGIGWIVCPVSVFLAESMDNLFNLISGFIAVQPLMIGAADNPLYTAWNISRTIANLAFVIVFLIIIYSQLTNLGVSKYGLKKLVPRLIVAAVLVNLSYYICAIAIDISNIIGYSIESVFTSIRHEVFHMTNDNFANVNNNPWTAVTNVVLAGGGIIGGIYYLASAGPYFLVTILVALGLVALLVILVLAARQAIIIALVMVAPLAFVAYLLPNTEKWFERWRELFMTMLVFFPAFAVVFAASQLAGQIIIQNAGDNMVTVLFGLAVQVAPLVVTPYLLKFSGGLLGKIANIANNPRKGVMDRTRGWQRERNDLHRQRALQKDTSGIKSVRAASAVQLLENRRRRRKELTDMYKLRAENKWQDTKSHGKIAERTALAELQKDDVHSRHAAHIDALKAGSGHQLVKGVDLHAAMVTAETSKVYAEEASAQLGATTSAYRAGIANTGGNPYLHEMQQKMAQSVIQTAAWKQAETNNQYQQQNAISTAMQNTDSLLSIAEGAGTPEMRTVGRERAQANAIATLTKLNKDARDNTITLMETEAVLAGQTVTDFAVNRVFRNANSSDLATRSAISKTRLEAALELAIADGQVGVFDEARSSEYIDQSVVDAVVARNTGAFKAKGGFHTQREPQLSLQRYIEKFNSGVAVNNNGDIATSEEEARLLFQRDLKRARLSTLSNTNAADIGNLKAGPFQKLMGDLLDGSETTGHLLDSLDYDANGNLVREEDFDMVKRTYDMLRDALEDPRTRASMSDRVKEARGIEEIYREKFFPGRPPLILPGDADYDARPAADQPGTPQAPETPQTPQNP